MKFIGYILFVFFLTCLPVLIGTTIYAQFSEKKRSFPGIEQFIWGHLTLIALFQIVCLVCVPLNTTFTFMTNIYIVLVAVTFFVSIFYLTSIKASLKEFVSNIPRSIMQFIKTTPCRAYIFYIGVLVIMICYVFYMNVSGSTGDDDTYLTLALCTLKNNGVNVVNPTYGVITSDTVAFRYAIAGWHQYIGFLGRISGIHTTIIAHTLLPVLLVTLAFGTYVLISRQLFPDKKTQYTFLILLLLIVVMGGYSWYTLTFRLLVCLWQGKGVMVSIILPFTFYYTLFHNNGHLQTLLALVILLLSGFATSYMSVGFIPFIILSAFLSKTSSEKKNNKDVSLDSTHKKGFTIVIVSIIVLSVVAAAIYLHQSKYIFPSTKAAYIEHFKESLDSIKEAYIHYWNGSNMQYLFVVCLLIIFISYFRCAKTRLFTTYIVSQIVLFFNPISIYLIHMFLTAWNEFIRSFYMFFPEIVIAYVLTFCISGLLAKKHKLLELLYIFPILFVMKSGTSFNTISQLKKADNPFHIPRTSMLICDYVSALHDDSGNNEDQITIISPESSIIPYIRQFDSDINLVWTRWDLSGYSDTKSRVVAYYDASSKYGAYIVLRSDSPDRELFEASGACAIAEIDNYIIYDKIHRRETALGYAEYYGDTDNLAYCYNIPNANISANWISNIVNAEGKAIRKLYYDAYKIPQEQEDGFGQIGYEYDNTNRVISTSYYDANGVPIIMPDGYHAVHITYMDPDDDRYKSISYFDTENNPTNINDNSYHIVFYYYTDDSFDVYRCEYKKANSTPATDTLGYFAAEYEYDDINRIKKVSWFDESNNPIALSGGQSSEEYIYDSYNRIVTYKYYDINGNPTAYYNLSFQKHYTYDENNNIIIIEFFDADGQPMLCHDGYYGHKQEFNTQNQLVSIKYYDLDWNKVLVSDLYFEQRPVYDDANNITSYEYYDLDGNLVMVQ